MKTEKKIFKSASIVAGALLTTTLVASPVAGMDILAYNDLGSGAQVRSHLIDANSAQAGLAEADAFKYAELKCGEDGKKAEKKADAKKAETKSAETKSADAKKGETKTATKATTTKATTTKATEEKAKEAKCGEGKCGEGKCGA